MARYQVILAYDGAAYCGFQRQAQRPSVQAVVEAALRQLGWRGRSLLAAGRTDTGAHAIGQVIAFDLEWQHSPGELQAALNSRLPADVVARSVREVDARFHPRYRALARHYGYRLFCQPERDPLRERFAWRVWPPVELQALQSQAQCLLGRHDFAAFGTPPRNGSSTIRTVFYASWRQAADLYWSPELIFEIVADAFLYRMVRRLVFVQVAMAQARLEPDLLVRSLENPPRAPLQGLAPAHGLTLLRVYYPDTQA